jgi:hypothetical protein
MRAKSARYANVNEARGILAGGKISPLPGTLRYRGFQPVCVKFFI